MIAKRTGYILLENGKIFDTYSDKYIKGSILIKNGIIQNIGFFSIPEKVKKIDCKNKIITSGFIDIHSHFREPGREDKETLLTGSQAAL